MSNAFSIPPRPSGRDEVLPFPVPPDSGLADVLLLIARILIGYIFVLSGWGKLMGLAGFAASLEQRGVPASEDSRLSAR